MKTDKLKYVLAFIFLLCAFLCGVNFKRWYTTNHRIEKMISLVYSSFPQYACYGNFEELLVQEFRKQGIEPIFEKFYLDFNTVTQHIYLSALIFFHKFLIGKTYVASHYRNGGK